MTRQRTETINTLGRRIAALREGTERHLPEQAAVVVAGKAHRVPEIVEALRVNIKLADALNSGRITFEEAYDEYMAALPALRTFVRGFAEAVRAQLGADNPRLRDFGIRPAGGQRSLRNLAMLPAGTADARRLRARPRGQPSRHPEAAGRGISLANSHQEILRSARDDDD
jgi:hypothetical protein